jgi:transcriptional regulator
MESIPPYQNRIELLQGTLDMLVLHSLLWGPLHGYAITNSIRSSSSDVLQVETGSLYPALHRLEKKGWIQSHWDTTENKQKAKFYQLTDAGRLQLTEERQRWDALTSAIAAVLQRHEA